MSRHSLLPLAAMLVSLAGLTVAGQASANCASGDSYGVYVEDTHVLVCPYGFDANEGRACPDTLGGMLRQNVASGDVVRLADSCAGSDRYEGAKDDCYIDQCVEAGTYRYGFAEPWSDPFCEGCPPSQYFVEVEVPVHHDVVCQRSAEVAVPEPYDAGVPWGDDPDMCDASPWGCTFSPHPRAVVFGVNALAAALGATLMVLRRRRRSGA